MDLALAEVGLLNSPIEEEDRVALSLQLGILLQNSVLQGRDSAEAAGCYLPDSLATVWWWTTATRTKNSATIKSPSAMLTEHVLILSSMPS